ncbi:TPA: prephenate dehydratase [Candidatus Avigastranaerophilus faecigallinarum]|nr:prephenate dehydratase [Candidatus Avigastranaerophilus faecigallinarum]
MYEKSIENIYYLGPDGSNTHNAMLKFLELSSIRVDNKIAEKSIKSALKNLEKDSNSICILPIENSIEGIVRETIGIFLDIKDDKIHILGEITLPIRHMLLSKSKDKTKIRKIYSHPQALAQCSKFLYQNFPDVELKEVSSTSYAAQKVSTEDDYSIAAIANETCAKLFDLNVLSNDINDEKDNKTRFYILGRFNDCVENTGKTSIILSTKNYPGALCDVLQIFSKYGLNLTYIDSRPSKRKLGEYLFFVEFDGVKTDENVKIAITELMNFVDFFKILGSFKIYN